MSKRKASVPLSRRNLLKGATLAGAAAVGTPLAGRAQDASPRPAGPVTPAPNPAMESGHPAERPIIQTSSGSDYMADVIKSLGIEHVACNPGTSFRGLHESLINYLKIDWHTCTHEEASVAMANGFAKIEGKPILTLAHGTVGLQHASMALYNAWCDRVPVYMMVGNTVDATKRAPGGEWYHSVQDAGALVRDFMKWDDQPGSLTHFGESAVRAYTIAMTPPMAPVLLVLDSEMQDGPVPPHEKLVVPRLPKIAPIVGDPGAIAETAQLLVNASNPVLVADRLARSQAGVDGLVELADLLQCAVVDLGGRMNFPSRHPLNQSDRPRPVIGQADVIVGFELENFWGATHAFHDNIERYAETVIRPGTRLVSIGAAPLYVKANYQDFQRFAEVDLTIPADAEATLPFLIEAVKHALPGDRKAAMAARGEKLAAAHLQAIKALKNDRHRPARRRGLGGDPQRGLVDRRHQQQQSPALAAAAVGHDQVLSPHRAGRRRRHRLRRACDRRRRARQPQAWPHHARDPGRWRPHVFAGCVVDLRAQPPAGALCDAQQPRLSPGDHGPAAHGQPAPARHRPHPYRGDPGRSVHRLCGSCPQPRGRGLRPDRESE